jgi:hypothetical protein
MSRIGYKIFICLFNRLGQLNICSFCIFQARPYNAEQLYINVLGERQARRNQVCLLLCFWFFTLFMTFCPCAVAYCSGWPLWVLTTCFIFWKNIFITSKFFGDLLFYSILPFFLFSFKVSVQDFCHPTTRLSQKLLWLERSRFGLQVSSRHKCEQSTIQKEKTHIGEGRRTKECQTAKEAPRFSYYWWPRLEEQ